MPLNGRKVANMVNLTTFVPYEGSKFHTKFEFYEFYFWKVLNTVPYVVQFYFKRKKKYLCKYFWRLYK